MNAVAGRNIAAEDDQVPGGHPVTMISYGYWQRRFARAPSAIGKVVQLNGTSFTIVGVAPPRFFGMEVGSAPEIMVPLMMQPQMMPAVGSWLDRPVNVVNWLHVVGRLKPGTTREQVQSAANALYRHIMADEALNARHRQSALSSQTYGSTDVPLGNCGSSARGIGRLLAPGPAREQGRSDGVVAV